ncbi:preprotein translocase subunit YajC [Rhizosaccharibacter radicis]
MNFLVSPAYAQEAAGGTAGAMGGLLQILPFILVFVVFYFLLMRPQQQKQKQLKGQLAALRRGDRVVTAGGIVGVVQRAKEGATEIEVEIAPTVRVLVMRDTITTVLRDVPQAAANDSAPEKRAAKG